MKFDPRDVITLVFLYPTVLIKNDDYSTKLAVDDFVLFTSKAVKEFTAFNITDFKCGLV